MKFVLHRLNHRFLALPNQVEVSLACVSDSFKDMEAGEVTVVVQADDIKSMSLAEIERLAVERASVLIK